MKNAFECSGSSPQQVEVLSSCPVVPAKALASAHRVTEVKSIRDKEDASSICGMDSENLGIFVRDGVIGVAQKLVDLKPYIDELWRRIDRGEVILGCSTKKEFCQQVLHRTPRAVRYMLEGGNHNRGEIVSPSKSQKDAPRQITKSQLAPETPTGIPETLKDIRLELCSRTDPRYENIRENHYIENHGCIGKQAHFLIHYKGEVAGIISGVSPAYATSPRDRFFGIDKGNRDKFLQGIVNNIVFRLENHEQNLATRVLCLWRNLIPHLWYEKYGAVVYGFETFVIENDNRKGALYKADNWTSAGTTAGATKVRSGIEKPADNWKDVTPKLVFCRWRDGFAAPCSAATPQWVQKMCGNILRSSEEQPWKPRTIKERWAAAGSQSWSHSDVVLNTAATEPETAIARDTTHEPTNTEPETSKCESNCGLISGHRGDCKPDVEKVRGFTIVEGKNVTRVEIGTAKATREKIRLARVGSVTTH